MDWFIYYQLSDLQFLVFQTRQLIVFGLISFKLLTPMNAYAQTSDERYSDTYLISLVNSTDNLLKELCDSVHESIPELEFTELHISQNLIRSKSRRNYVVRQIKLHVNGTSYEIREESNSHNVIKNDSNPLLNFWVCTSFVQLMQKVILDFDLKVRVSNGTSYCGATKHKDLFSLCIVREAEQISGIGYSTDGLIYIFNSFDSMGLFNRLTKEEVNEIQTCLHKTYISSDYDVRKCLKPIGYSKNTEEYLWSDPKTTIDSLVSHFEEFQNLISNKNYFKKPTDRKPYYRIKLGGTVFKFDSLYNDQSGTCDWTTSDKIVDMFNKFLIEDNSSIRLLEKGLFGPYPVECLYPTDIYFVLTEEQYLFLLKSGYQFRQSIDVFH